MPDIGLAVAVEIDRVLVVFRGQELREAHRAAPRGAHVGGVDAVLQHFQRRQELVPEEVLALPVKALRREHTGRAVREFISAERGFAPPDRQHDLRRHAELLLDAGKRRAVLIEQLTALRGQVRERQLAQVLGRRLHELGLAARRRFRTAGND